jgi:uncharacterized membrane protein
MNTFTRVTLAALALTGAQLSQAASFNTVAGTSFTEYFNVTPSTTNKLTLTVSAPAVQFSALNFEFLSGGPAIVTKLRNNVFSVVFNDLLNTGYTLNSGTAYGFKVSGVTKTQPPGVFGVVSITANNGTVSPVPEPETYAMLLAGLGLMGTIARRRAQKEAA